MSAERKPGEFRVGDRVRHIRAGCSGVVLEILGGEFNNILVHWDNDNRVNSNQVIPSTMPNLALIEPSQPAREGEGAASSTAALNRGSDPATLPPAPPASDFERLRDFFKDKRPQAVPFALGQKVEAAVRQEACPTCHHGRIFFPETRQVIDCPECGGSGWQEVR